MPAILPLSPRPNRRTSHVLAAICSFGLLLLTGCHATQTMQTERIEIEAPSEAATPPHEANADEYAKRAETLEKQQQYAQALNEWLAQTPLLMTEAALRANSLAVWRVLSSMSNQDFANLLHSKQQQASGQLFGGWVALAQIQRLGSNDLEKQAQLVREWQQNWPLHPANTYMPEDMKLLRNLTKNQPKQIALLLPFTGKHAAAAQAIRDGFLAAYYQSLAQGAPAVQINMVDSGTGANVLPVYQKAVAQGAELVIGPLEREQVQVLARQTTLPVPTLALNDLSETPALNAQKTPENLYQFSLNPDDEAQQAADIAFAQNYRRALILQTDNERGTRLARSFRQRWQALGGTVAADVRFNPAGGDSRAAVAKALGVSGDLGNPAHRRQDIDVLFLVGSRTDANLILPALAYNNAADLPVYTGSQIFNAQTTLRGNDLDGLRFCLAPWQVSDSGLRAEIQRFSPQDGADLLYAMGADAQQLYPRLALMRANPNLRLSRYTGYLHLNPQRRIEREFVWRMMQGGMAVPLSADSAIATDAAPIPNNAPATDGEQSPTAMTPEAQ